MSVATSTYQRTVWGPQEPSEVVMGAVVPRLWTPAGRELSPETSYGFAVADFARDVLGRPLDPWQEWLVVHAGELLPDGRPRFRKVLVLVARQNGKTELCVVLSLFWLFVQRVPLVLGTSTVLDYARESWDKAVVLAETTRELSDQVPEKGGVRRANGEQTLMTDDRCRYKIAPSNRKGGRSLTVHRLVMDELREHHDWSAWNAAVPAMNAVPDAQCWAISNQGDDQSVVLDATRAAALETLVAGEGDPRLGMFEWSAPDGAEPTDPEALAMANPSLGVRIELGSLLGDAARAVAHGGEELAGFRTETMCQRVKLMNPAVDPARWLACLDPGDMGAVRDRVALCVDVSLDGLHACLVAAAVLDDGRVRVEVVKAWSGRGCTQELRSELGGLVRTVNPVAVGWFPAGPAATVAADLADRGQAGRGAWPLSGVSVEEIRGEATAVCMGFADLVEAGQVAHSADPMLDAHVHAAERLQQGDAWRYTRKGAGHVDGAYAAAGAVHLAKTTPPRSRPRMRMIR